MSASTGKLDGGISAPQEGTEWHVLGHTYWNRAWCGASFAFETHDPPGTFVPPHVHPDQDEFICVLENELEVELDGERRRAPEGSLVKLPRGVAHAYYNPSDRPTRCLFWVSPAGRLKELFDRLHGLTDPDEVVRVSAEHDVHFLPPPAG